MNTDRSRVQDKTLASVLDRHVHLGMDLNVREGSGGSKGLFGAPPLFMSIEGEAETIRDKSAMEALWTPDLERWWKNGVNTPGLVLAKVHASRNHYWNGEEDGEITLDRG